MLKKVILASASKVKEEAVFQAFKKLGIDIDLTVLKGISSEVNEQPVGSEETQKGVINRNSYALKHLENTGAHWDYIISVENGIFWHRINEGQWYDRTIVSIQKKEGGPLIIFPGEDGVIFPNNFVNEAREIGFDKTTVEQVMFEAGYVEDSKDPHKTLVGRSRVEFIVDGILKAFNFEIEG